MWEKDRERERKREKQLLNITYLSIFFPNRHTFAMYVEIV